MVGPIEVDHAENFKSGCKTRRKLLADSQYINIQLPQIFHAQRFGHEELSKVLSS